MDGDAWCALCGENIQSGISGFGPTPSEALGSLSASWDDTDTSTAADRAPKTPEEWDRARRTWVKPHYVGERVRIERGELEEIGLSGTVINPRDEGGNVVVHVDGEPRPRRFRQGALVSLPVKLEPNRVMVNGE
jgi:hypothetical protein